MARSRAFATGLGLALIAAACGGDDGVTSTSGEGQTGGDGGQPPAVDPIEATCPGEPAAAERVERGPQEDVPSALEDMEQEDLPDPLVDPDEVLSGGPPPDGIPAIDRPKFQPACSVDWLAPAEPVVVLEVEGESRAYPLQIMTWHEIVNDVVGGVPVTVTYCPLCNSAFAFDREVGDRLLDFGTSGSLYQSNLVMYDRQTESLWAQLGLEAIAGVLTGTELSTRAMQTVAWEDFLDAHPASLVLSRDTGHTRDYGRNPYPGYDRVDGSPIFPTEGDDRLPAMTRVVTLRHNGDVVAVATDALLETGVMEVDVGGDVMVFFAKPGTSSALDTGNLPEGRDVGTTGVFDPVVDGQALTFSPTDDGSFTDEQTGSTWNILGEATSGELEGTQLESFAHDNTLWFSWAAFEPDTRVVQ